MTQGALSQYDGSALAFADAAENPDEERGRAAKLDEFAGADALVRDRSLDHAVVRLGGHHARVER